MLDQTRLLALLKKQTEEAGSQKAFAHRIGISQQYLTDVLKGRRLPGPKILKMLGYEAEVMYKKVYHLDGLRQMGAAADEPKQQLQTIGVGPNNRVAK